MCKQQVPETLMGYLREQRGLEPTDTSEDEAILSMPGASFLEEWLAWEGIFGYTRQIIETIKCAFGINLDNLETPEREREK